MSGYSSPKTPPSPSDSTEQPSSAAAQPKAERPWAMKWVFLAILVFVVIFNVYFFVFHDK